ncbi:MAG: hypothetical protein J6K61_00810 [Clostridia bacterium]|nr:hypothetical protein [Clostridia bacterium]
MIFVKSPNSTLFDEAYFVLRENGGNRPTRQDMVAEAERLLRGEDEENGSSVAQTRKGGVWRFFLWGFLCGAAAVGVVCLFAL